MTVYDWCLLYHNNEMLNLLRDKQVTNDLLINCFSYSEDDKINDLKSINFLFFIFLIDSTSLPPIFIKDLLREYSGNVEMILVEYYNNQLKVTKEMECEVCCEKRSSKDFFWLNCNDCYCKICWKTYLENEIRVYNI